MADHRATVACALAAVVVLASAAGCGGSASSAAPRLYAQAQVQKAFLRPRDTPDPDFGSWVDPVAHSHVDYVPFGSIEVCPLTQRADVTPGTRHVLLPKAAQPTRQFSIAPANADDNHLTPTILESGLVFGTNTIADQAMAKVTAAMNGCPQTYSVRSGPPHILGSYSLSARPVEIDGWSGVGQQIAHSYQADDVFYEDIAHVVVHRDNVVLDIVLTHEHVVGDRSDALQLAQDTTKRIVDRLNG